MVRITKQHHHQQPARKPAMKSYLITAAIALAAVAVAMRVEPLKKLVTGA